MAVQTIQYSVVFTIGLLFLITKASLAKSPPYEDAQISIRLLDPQDVIVARGQPASLSCRIYSNVSVDLRWLYNGQVIFGNDTRFYQLENGTLTIPKVSGRKVNGSLEGDYQCSVRNKYGALLSSPAKLRVAVIGKEFQEQPTDVTVGEGQPLVLPCKIHSYPKPLVAWDFKQQQLPQTLRYVPLPSGTLLITSIHSSDEGFYSCSVVNPILKNKPKLSNIAKVTVVASSPAAPQHLPLGLSPNLTALLGEDLNLYCAVSGWPLPTIKWYRGNRLLLDNSSILKLEKVSADHTGFYTCSGTNKFGSTNQTYRVEIQQPPYFNHTLESRIFPPPAMLKTPCFASGIPTPKVYWLANGTALNYNDNRIRFRDSQLNITNTLTTDAGIYQCFAENPAGKSWISVQYYSRLPPEKIPLPPENLQCVPYNSTSVCVRWSDPPNVTPKAYMLFSYNAGRGPEYLTIVKQHLATGLNESTTYSFFVRLFLNSSSDNSSDIQCTTGTIGERKLRVNRTNSNAATLSWLTISSDFSCDNRTIRYRIHWKLDGNGTVLNVKYVTGVTTAVINDLKVGNVYQLRVASVTEKHALSDWVNLEIPLNPEVNLSRSNVRPTALYNLYVTDVGSSVVDLHWSTNYKNIMIVYICYFEAYSDKSCEFSTGLHNLTTRLEYIKIRDLNPSTAYEFFTKVTFEDGSQDIKIIEASTLPAGPITIQDVTYHMVNPTTACVKWRAPFNNPKGKYIRYTVVYKGQDCVSKYVNVTASVANMNKACWLDQMDGSNIMSVLLPQLNPDESYTLIVQPEQNSSVISSPEISLSTKLFNKFSTEHNVAPDAGLDYEQKLGIALGVSIALCGFICCSACLIFIVIKKHKAQTINTTRFYINEMRPSCHLRGGCSSIPRERENLLINGFRTSNIPMVTPNLDTKGDASYPNKHMNGSANPQKPKKPYTTNGHVHIMENPQYSFGDVECTSNGHPPTLKPYDEDANSNLSDTNLDQNSTLPDFPDTSSGNSSVLSLGSHEITQLTCLDTSGAFQVSFRNVAVPLGPNG